MTPDLARYLPVGEERMLLLGILGFLLLTNALTFAAFAIDSGRAKAGGYRVPGKTLLLLSLLGGWPAAILARLLFRHQAQTRSFGLMLTVIVLTQIAGLGALFVPIDTVKGGIASLKDQAVAQVMPERDSESAAPEKAMPRRFGPGSEQSESAGGIGASGG